MRREECPRPRQKWAAAGRLFRSSSVRHEAYSPDAFSVSMVGNCRDSDCGACRRESVQLRIHFRPVRSHCPRPIGFIDIPGAGLIVGLLFPREDFLRIFLPTGILICSPSSLTQGPFLSRKFPPTLRRANDPHLAFEIWDSNISHPELVNPQSRKIPPTPSFQRQRNLRRNACQFPRIDTIDYRA